MNYQVDSLRIGKYIELELTAADAAQAETQLHKICREVLANPVTEVYSFELTPVSCG
jgi:phosphoribosylformylglycinamidine synthase